jgi:hypothetical protein
VSERDRYPAGGNLVESWERTGRTGRGRIEVPGSGEPLTVEWTEYRNPDGSYSSSYYGPQHLGVFTRAGRSFLVTETYTNTGITNSGKRVTRFRHRARNGVCCTEIVRALEAGEGLVLERVERGRDRGTWRLVVEQRRDHTFHEIDIETFRCTALFDLRRSRGVLRRTRFRDASQ